MDGEARQMYFRYNWPRWVGPLYYDYPDGEDLGGKLTFCGQFAFLLSAPIGIANAYIRHPYPTSNKGRFLRVLRAVVPGVGMGLAFAATTYYATRIRQKDDYLNHCFGGIAAGTILGAATSLRNGIAVATIAGTLAGICKYRDRKPKTNYQRKPLSYVLWSSSRGSPNKADNWIKAPSPEN